MSYSKLPVRTTADVNASADINTLSDNTSLFGGAAYSTASDYVITDSDDYGYILVNSSSGTVTVTLPTLADNQDREITIMHETSGNEIVVDGEGGETIDGLGTVNLPKADDYMRIKATSNEWRIIEEKISSQLRLDTYAGYGSIDTKIMRFSNSRENYGNMFTENHSTGYNGNTEGLEVTIARNGKYSFSFSWLSEAGSSQVGGISLNSSQLTTIIASINAQDRLSIDQAAASANATASWTGYLAANDIIRAHAEGKVPTTAARCHFTATYLGS